jgi:hypothetical protein
MAGDVELNPGPIMTCLNIGHINARSLVNEEKFEEISSFIFQKNFELFAITETWLNNQISNDDLCIPGFHAIVRKDRPNTRGGGVALYITQSLAFKRRNDLENNNLELLWVEVKYINKPYYAEFVIERQITLCKMYQFFGIPYKVL